MFVCRLLIFFEIYNLKNILSGIQPRSFWNTTRKSNFQNIHLLAGQGLTGVHCITGGLHGALWHTAFQQHVTKKYFVVLCD